MQHEKLDEFFSNFNSRYWLDFSCFFFLLRGVDARAAVDTN